MSIQMCNNVLIRRNVKVGVYLYGVFNTNLGSKMSYTLVHNGVTVGEFKSGHRRDALEQYKKIVDKHNT